MPTGDPSNVKHVEHYGGWYPPVPVCQPASPVVFASPCNCATEISILRQEIAELKQLIKDMKP